MADEKIMLEITMESNGYNGHKYIKRSFPAKEGRLNMDKYGFPYKCYPVSIITEYPKYGGHSDCVIVAINGNMNELVSVPLHDFVTVKKHYREPTVIDSYLKVPKPGGEAEVYITFYAYIE